MPSVLTNFEFRINRVDSKPDAVDRLRARVSDIYTDVVSSDECIERLVCELGGAAKNIYYKDSVIR